MRTQLWVLDMLLAMSLVLSGCQVGRSDTTTDPDTEQMIIQGCEIDPRSDASWTKIEEFEFDLTNDGQTDFIGLYTMAAQDAKGNFMWDDGQQWLLMVQAGDKFYPLLAEYVQLGNVYFTVSQEMEDLKSKITVLVPTGANLKLESFTYDVEQQGFVQEMLYDSPEDNFLYNSIPAY